MLNTKCSPESTLQSQLARQELLDISQKISHDFSPSKPVKAPENGIDMLLTRQQLLEVSENISLYYAPRILSNTDSLVLLPIDPKHFFVYWNLANYQQYEQAHNHQNNDLKLKVFSKCKTKKTQLVYETTVSATQPGQKISLQKTEQGVVYSASLGKSLSENHFIALLNSNDIYSFFETYNSAKQLVNKKSEGCALDRARSIDNLEINKIKTKKSVLSVNSIRFNASGQGKKK